MNEHLEKLAQAVADSDAVDIMVLTRDMEVVWLSPHMEKVVGMTLAEVGGRTCHEAFAGDAAPHPGCTARKALELGRPVRQIESLNGVPHLVVALPLGERHVGELVVRLGDLAQPTGVAPILARRSIRKYTCDPVSEKHVRMLLEAGMAAPSGKNLRPWHFVVVTDRGKLDRLAETGTFWRMLHEAPLAIVICGDPGISDRYYDQDAAAATENILLAVSMLGLGGVWLGCHPNPERMDPVREILGIPEAIVPVAMVSVGHPAEEKEPRTQYEEGRVHKDRW
ncbi:MAG: nitroreductase family protein [Candidatus Eisenbacteria bacterium]|nr:nitroreductase family protein [Candidatus Eisenbacteria bacterium]